jgi:hypothetical protein
MSLTLHFHGRGRRVFRSRLAHGTPKMFKSFSNTTSCHIRQALTELAVLRLRKLVVDFRYIPKKQSYDGEEYYDDDGQERLEELQKEMQDLPKTITKTKVLVQLHFEIQTTSCLHVILRTARTGLGFGPTVNNGNHELFDTFAPLIVAAARQRFRLTAKENQVFLRKSQVLSRHPPQSISSTTKTLSFSSSTTQQLPDSEVQHHLNQAFRAPSQSKPPRSRRQRHKAFERVEYPQLDHSLIPRMPKVLRHIQRGNQSSRHTLPHIPNTRFRL